jgi:photosystem II stability/assembly factor-like uncharacterized protein
MDHRHREEVRSRIRAAIGEPDPARPELDLEALARKRPSRARPGPGDLPGPLRIPALVALVALVVAALGVGTVIGLRQRLETPPAAAGRTPSPSPGPSIAAFVPADVTAISTSEWWVAGSDASGCSGTGCSRILWTVDAGQSFTSLPTPPIATTHLRFANPRDGWAYDGVSAAVWATHDGGQTWSMASLPGPVAGLETSGGFVYAIVCPAGAAGCLLDRSADENDSWTPLAVAAGSGRLSDVNVHGADVWLAADRDLPAADEVLRSTDDGSHFTAFPVCAGAGAGVTSLDAVDADVVWVLCATSTEAQAWRSLRGGANFAPVDPEGSVRGVAIAATSAQRAVVAGADLELTTDGGRSFQSVLDKLAQWNLIGFTTATAGFAIADPGGADAALWRTDDGGATWRDVSFS